MSAVATKLPDIWCLWWQDWTGRYVGVGAKLPEVQKRYFATKDAAEAEKGALLAKATEFKREITACVTKSDYISKTKKRR